MDSREAGTGMKEVFDSRVQEQVEHLKMWANLMTIVHGTAIEETAQLGRSRIRVGSREIVERSPVRLEVIGEIFWEECRSLKV
jgi:hypothetical protein